MPVYTLEALMVGAVIGFAFIVFGWLFKQIVEQEIEQIARNKAKEKIDLHEEIHHNNNND